jgi:CBS domain-containing protein
MLVRRIMKVRDIMRPGPFTIQPIATLGSAQRVMNRNRIRHLPVMLDGKLVGILSERDILAARARADRDDEWWMLPVGDAMHAPVQTAGPDDSLTEVAGRLASAKIGALPVVERGRLLGIATATDVLEGEVRAAMGPSSSTQLIAADVMTAWPYTVHPETLLVEAVRLMFDRHIRHLPVVDAKSTLKGMLSERDVRGAIGNPVDYMELRPRTTAQFHVSDLMTRPAIAIPFDEPLVKLASRFADDNVGALPVLDRFGAVIGIVSYVDALRVLAR